MLRLDANRAWDPETARRFCAVVADADIDYVEEPLRRTTPEDLATLRSKTGVPVALDESISTAADLDCYVTARSCDAVVLKLTRIGTPYVFIELASRATSRGIGVTVTDSLETEIGQRIALHLAAAIGARSATGLAGSALLADATLDTGTASRADGLPRADGPPRAASEASMPAGPMLQISGPGLGMSEEALARVWDAS
jgi:L-alanine-DL-glutamate epimerase-like enolase superfamily enzyme